MAAKKITLSEAIKVFTTKMKQIFADEEIIDDTKTEMAEATVADTGIIVRAESWEPGQAVVAVEVGEEGETETAMPEGSYVLDNGATLVIDENSTITEVIEAEVEVEVDAEKDKDKEEMSVEPKYVTEEQFTATIAEFTKAMERMSVKMSEMAPAKEKEETDSEKVLAENKLLKQRLSEKKKAIADKAEPKENNPLPADFGRTKRGHVSGTRQRVAEKFKDFDFTVKMTTDEVEVSQN